MVETARQIDNGLVDRVEYNKDRLWGTFGRRKGAQDVVDIGPNLLAAILALVSLGTALVAAWRAERAIAHTQDQSRQVGSNSARIDEIEKAMNGGDQDATK